MAWDDQYSIHNNRYQCAVIFQCMDRLGSSYRKQHQLHHVFISSLFCCTFENRYHETDTIGSTAMAAVHHHQCVVIIINAILLRFSTMTDTHNIYIGKKAPAPVLCLSNHTQYTDTQTIAYMEEKKSYLWFDDGIDVCACVCDTFSMCAHRFIRVAQLSKVICFRLSLWILWS